MSSIEEAESQLGACPFCDGSRASVLELDTDQWAVSCGSCGVIGPSGRTEVEAAQRWNRRSLGGRRKVMGLDDSQT